VPALREHAEDVPALIRHFLRKLSVSSHRPLRISDEALKRLREYSWPGNVRQLWAVLEYAVYQSDDNVLGVADLPPLPEGGNEEADLNLEHLEERAIKAALRRTGGVVMQAARLLGIHRDTLASKMKEYKIEKNGEG